MAEINGEEKRITVSGEQIEEVVGKVPTIEADVKSNKQNISALQTASAQHTADIAKNTADIEKKANAEEVYSREETDSAITAKVAEIVAGAPEEFDTLKEMSDWLTEHSDSAATMNSAIQENTKAIADNATAIETANEAIEQNKSDILSAENDIAINRNAIAVNRNTLGFQKKNLIDQSLLLNASGWTVDENGVYSGNIHNLHVYVQNGYPIETEFRENTQYTLSYDIKSGVNTSSTDQKTLSVMAFYTDGTSKLMGYHTATGEFEKFTATSLAGKTLKRLRFEYYNNKTCYIKNMQLEEGTVATEYEPYNPKPSLQEQINALVAEIAELKTQITTVSE